MTQKQSAFDAGMGQPNPMAEQYTQDNMNKDRIDSSLHCSKTIVGPSGDSGVTIDIPVGAKIVDVIVQCTASNGSGTITIKTDAASPTSVSDAITCETADDIDRADSIDADYAIVGADGLQADANGADDEGIVYVTYLK